MPERFRRTFAASHNLSVGDVLYLHCDFITPEKCKYMVVCCCEPLLILLINSEINEFILSRSALLQCQVDLPESEHPFLEWDSVVNCIEAHQAFDINEVRELIIEDYQKVFKGRVVDYCLRNILQAVELSEVMLRSHKRAIVAAMSHYR